MHLWHRLAAFLAKAGRGARHGLAAFHCLGRSGRAGTIENIGHERSREEYDENWSPKTHLLQAKGEGDATQEEGQARLPESGRCGNDDQQKTEPGRFAEGPRHPG